MWPELNKFMTKVCNGMGELQCLCLEFDAFKGGYFFWQFL